MRVDEIEKIPHADPGNSCKKMEPTKKRLQQIINIHVTLLLRKDFFPLPVEFRSASPLTLLTVHTPYLVSFLRTNGHSLCLTIRYPRRPPWRQSLRPCSPALLT